MQAPEVVLLGGSNSGKTHFAGQLYGRLQRRPGKLHLRIDRGTPPDLTTLQEVLRCLEEGHAAAHTSADAWGEVLLPLLDSQGRAFDLRWPDYAGEQLRQVFVRREVPELWRARLIAAHAWVLLIRVKGETTYPDALSELNRIREHRRDVSMRMESWDANARWVELLQMLLHVSQRGSVSRLVRPRLAVLLSCYDELDAGEKRPGQVLAEALPMVATYIENIWQPNAVSVWGLSALGCSLTADSADARFIEDGPETQGWVVNPNGGKTDPDLTRPLAWLLR